MKKVKRINLSSAEDPDLMGLINTLARLQDLKPATALKRFLRHSLPKVIEREQRNLTHFNGRRQAKTAQTDARAKHSPARFSPHSFLPVITAPCEPLETAVEADQKELSSDEIRKNKTGTAASKRKRPA